MSEPIRSASASPLAAARPQVHSRRVSLRIGAFGLTYSTDRLLWDPAAATDAAPVDSVPAVDPALAVDPQPTDAAQEPARAFPVELDTARQQALWLAAQQQAQQQQTGQEARRQEARETPSPEPVAASQAQPDPAQAGQASGARTEGGQSEQAAGLGRGKALRQAMRQATSAYLACARRFACPPPMLRAVA